MKKILGVYSAPRPHWVGDGFPVRSLFGYDGLGRHLSPFLLLDHAAPTHFEPTTRPRGVGSHPHRGFETVTIVYQGEVAHRDSTGAGGVIGPGDVQWMTAAGGIVHEEFHSPAFTQSGGTVEMVQLWVNLPAKDKMAAPGYQNLLNGNIPSVELPDGAGRVRVIAGSYAGQTGPARTFTPMNVWDVRIRAGQTLQLPHANWPLETTDPEGLERFAVIVSEHARDFSHLGADKMAWFQNLPTGSNGAALVRGHQGRGSALAGRARCTEPDCDRYGATLFAVDVVGVRRVVGVMRVEGEGGS